LRGSLARRQTIGRLLMARTGTMRRPCVLRKSWCCRWLLPSRLMRCLRLRPARSNALRSERGTCARSHDALRPGGQIRGHRLSFRLVLAWDTARRLTVLSALAFAGTLPLLASALLPLRLCLGPPRSETLGEWVGPAAVAANMFAGVVRRARLPVTTPASAGVLIIELACVLAEPRICRFLRRLSFGCFRCFARSPYRSPSGGRWLVALSRRCTAAGHQGIICVFCVSCE